MLLPLLLLPLLVQEGSEVVFTIRSPATSINGSQVIGVSYDSFIEDVEVPPRPRPRCWTPRFASPPLCTSSHE